MNSRQPNSRNCFVCGVTNPFGLHLCFYNTGPGEVTAEAVIPEEYQSYPGIVHGGVIAALLDEAAGRVQMGDNASPRFMYTAHLDVHYRKTVPVGKPIRLVGKVGLTKRRTAAASSAIYDQDGVLLAEAEALMVDIPSEMFDNQDLEQVGWRVYSDDELNCQEP